MAKELALCKSNATTFGAKRPTIVNSDSISRYKLSEVSERRYRVSRDWLLTFPLTLTPTPPWFPSSPQFSLSRRFKHRRSPAERNVCCWRGSENGEQKDQSERNIVLPEELPFESFRVLGDRSSRLERTGELRKKQESMAITDCREIRKEYKNSSIVLVKHCAR